jgi:hypothetical protein
MCHNFLAVTIEKNTVKEQQVIEKVIIMCHVFVDFLVPHKPTKESGIKQEGNKNKYF